MLPLVSQPRRPLTCSTNPPTRQTSTSPQNLHLLHCIQIHLKQPLKEQEQQQQDHQHQQSVLQQLNHQHPAERVLSPRYMNLAQDSFLLGTGSPLSSLHHPTRTQKPQQNSKYPQKNNEQKTSISSMVSQTSILNHAIIFRKRRQLEQAPRAGSPATSLSTTINTTTEAASQINSSSTTPLRMPCLSGYYSQCSSPRGSNLQLEEPSNCDKLGNESTDDSILENSSKIITRKLNTNRYSSKPTLLTRATKEEKTLSQSESSEIVVKHSSDTKSNSRLQQCASSSSSTSSPQSKQRDQMPRSHSPLLLQNILRNSQNVYPKEIFTQSTMLSDEEKVQQRIRSISEDVRTFSQSHGSNLFTATTPMELAKRISRNNRNFQVKSIILNDTLMKLVTPPSAAAQHASRFTQVPVEAFASPYKVSGISAATATNNNNNSSNGKSTKRSSHLERPTTTKTYNNEESNSYHVKYSQSPKKSGVSAAAPGSLARPAVVLNMKFAGNRNNEYPIESESMSQSGSNYPKKHQGFQIRSKNFRQKLHLMRLASNSESISKISCSSASPIKQQIPSTIMQSASPQQVGSISKQSNHIFDEMSYETKVNAQLMSLNLQGRSLQSRMSMALEESDRYAVPTQKYEGDSPNTKKLLKYFDWKYEKKHEHGLLDATEHDEFGFYVSRQQENQESIRGKKRFDSATTTQAGSNGDNQLTGNSNLLSVGPWMVSNNQENNTEPECISQFLFEKKAGVAILR